MINQSRTKDKKNHLLTMPVQYLSGVGPRMSEVLSRVGIRTLEDLLYYYPRDWEDRRQFGPLKDARPGQSGTFRGIIKDFGFQETRNGLIIVSALMEDASGVMLCKWMRRKNYRYDVLKPFRDELQNGRTLLAHGKIEPDLAGVCMQVDEHEVFAGAAEDSIHIDRIVPVYPLTEGLRQKFLRRIVFETLSSVSVEDILPRSIRDAHGLMPLEAALHELHFPGTLEDKARARERLVFQELFMLQMVLAAARNQRRITRPVRYAIKRNLLTPFREKCGFEFTPSQKKVINEIFGDMTSDYPMNRLLQGDVGSGKTVVALSAMLLACENRSQSVLMSPTEILAEQHYITLRHFLEGLPVRVGLLTGSVKSRERRQFTQDCADGAVDIAVGTHALLENAIRFKNLGAVVIDEQHRFGVKHRMALTQISRNAQDGKPVSAPDVLIMTATPIPRTLALGLYDDLDLSVIDALPPGRPAVSTVCRTESEAWALVKKEVQKGRQAYIVYPLVDESDRTELKAAIQEFERLRSMDFKDFSVGLLHGQMPGKEKERIMKGFYEGRFSVLIATTVIEVGIDVPNATVMVIQHADRFGLSTLHQLRGRVGRGKDPSVCVLVGDPKTADARQRLEVLVRTTNGFELAEKDLEIRGHGEIFGTSQHGLPDLKIASLTADTKWVSASQTAARAWMDKDPDLNAPEIQMFKDHLKRHYARNWHLAAIG